MSRTAYTMPEPKYRSTKKRVQPVSSIRTSEFAQEVKSLDPARKAAQSKIHLVSERVEKAEARQSEKPAIKLTSFWPVAVGLFLAGFAPEWHAIAAQAGVWVMRITFPFAMLATHREIGIDAQMAGLLPQFAVFAQLPIDGLMMALSMLRGKSLKTAILQVTSVHLLCAFVLWLLTFLAN
jgi:hypothetical protein